MPPSCETRACKRGDVLVRQGEPADALYIVVTGRFAVTLEAGARSIAEIGPDQPIGEIAFLTGGTRTATVTACATASCCGSGRAEFEQLSAKCPGIWRTLTVTLAHRLADDNVGRAAAARSAPAHHRHHPRRRQRSCRASFIDQLAAVFRRSSQHARARRPDTAARRAARAACALDSAEATRRSTRSRARYDYVLFIADAELTPWSEKAIRQADLVLAVGTARRRPDAQRARAAGRRAPASPRRSRLVLLHERARADRRARRAGCAGRSIAMHHHVALDDAERRRSGSTASSTARRSASSPAAAAPTARRTSASTRRCCESGLDVRHHGRHLGRRGA